MSLIGYTVMVDRTHQPHPNGRDIVGSVHADRDPAENHLAYCEGMADRRGDDARYSVVEVHAIAESS